MNRGRGNGWGYAVTAAEDRRTIADSLAGLATCQAVLGLGLVRPENQGLTPAMAVAADPELARRCGLDDAELACLRFYCDFEPTAEDALALEALRGTRVYGRGAEVYRRLAGWLGDDLLETEPARVRGWASKCKDRIRRSERRLAEG